MPKVPLQRILPPVLLWSMGILFLSACNITRNVPEGKMLLVDNHIYFNDKKTGGDDVFSTIRQKPNRSISMPGFRFEEGTLKGDHWVLWRPYLQLYNAGDASKEKGFKAWLARIGEAPVVLDSASTISSARQIGLYYYNQGYFFNEIEFQIHPVNRKGSKARVEYHIHSGPRYYFNDLEYVISSPGILGVVQKVRSETKITKGKPFNGKELEDERDRLVKEMRDNGYYGFPKSLVRFEADTSAGNRGVDIKLLVGDLPASVGDSLYYVEHLPYFIKNIYFIPNHNFSKGKSDVEDTTLYEGITLLHQVPMKYNPEFLENLVHFKPGETFSEVRVKESYSHITGSRVFQSAEITFERIPGDTTNSLNAIIKAQPLAKHNFTTELEGTTTAGNYGIAGMVTWLTRNVFKGGELLDLSLKGGLEAQVVLQGEDNVLFNTKELGAEVGLNFPRFVMLSGLNSRIPKRMEPRSRLFTSYNYQTRAEFERLIFKVGLMYMWKESVTKLHQINLVDISYVALPRIDQDYYNSLEFKSGFQNNLIMAMRYTFLYDNHRVKRTGTHQFLKASIEPAGNFLAALNYDEKFAYDAESDQYLILGVPYAQYVKLDADFRHFVSLTPENQLAFRLYAGATYNYGNSPYLPPFEKSFLAGGSNDMRGWQAYRLGPGTLPKIYYSSGSSGYASVAPIKLMFNSEYRFPIIQSFRGAVFFDVGNIWLFNKPFPTTDISDLEKALIEHGVFYLDRFYKQLAFNTGFGIRYDFGFFALRLDLGMRVIDPTEDAGSRYVLPDLKWNTITYNIALGYPF